MRDDASSRPILRVCLAFMVGFTACNSNGPTVPDELGFGTVELSGAVERSAQLPALVTPAILLAADSFLYSVSLGGITDDLVVTLPIVSASDPAPDSYPATGSPFTASVRLDGGIRDEERVFDAVNGSIQLDSVHENAWVGSFDFDARDSTDAELHASGAFRALTPQALTP